eukprot:UN06240
MILISGSQLMKDSEPIVCMVGRELVRCVTIQDNSNPWFAIDFVDKYARPSDYMLRHYSSWDTECLRNWVFEGSMDGERWIRLRHHDNDTTLSKKDNKLYGIYQIQVVISVNLELNRQDQTRIYIIIWHVLGLNYMVNFIKRIIHILT